MGTRNAKRVEFLNALRSVFGPKPGYAVIHSSLAAFAPPGGLEPWDILSAFETLASEGWTLAFPSFTFSFCRTGQYNPLTMPSETGVLADWVFQKLAGARRSLHPIYSYAVIGPDANALVTLEAKSCFGENSPLELFESVDALQVMLGCGWDFCTQTHRYEELAQVPYRYYKTFSGKYILPTEMPVAVDMFVRDLESDPLNTLVPMIEALAQQAMTQNITLWRGTISTARTSAIRNLCLKLLEQNPYALVEEAPRVALSLQNQQERSKNNSIKIAIIGSSNLDLFKNPLLETLKTLVPERSFEIYTIPYGQIDQQLLSPNSELSKFSPQIVTFLDRPEDALGEYLSFSDEHDQARHRLTSLATLLYNFSERTGCWLILPVFAALTPLDPGRTRGYADRLSDYRSIFATKFSERRKTAWIDIGAEAALSGKGRPVDPRLWRMGRIPYSHAFTRHLSDKIASLIVSMIGKTCRLIVVDLDNTLWGGVLGEDGLEGIHIGGDYPGNAFSKLQRLLKDLSARGIALAIASKNDEDLVLNTLDAHDEIILKKTDFVTHRINWLPKWQNIQAIAEELNLGLGSVLFIDDNPVEREAVRRNLPSVKILPMPDDPADYADALLLSPWIAAAEIVEEDFQRVESYKNRKNLEAARQSAQNIDEFLSSLGMKLYFQRLSDSNISRTTQLCQKTNQFNTTTRRYEAQDLLKIEREGGIVAVLGLEDMMNKKENIGLIVLKEIESGAAGLVDLYLLSCRILGRRIETSVLFWALAMGRRHGWSRLDGEIIDTPRNTPVRSIFKDAGFEYDEKAARWTRMTTDAPPISEIFAITDEFTR